MSRNLQNYLRTYRKRAGFSQDEVAFLLGCHSGAKVSRYEKFNRKPSLETALGYEAVFGAPSRDLFAGVSQKVEEKIKERAQLLSLKLSEGKRDRMTLRKINFLQSITSGAGIEPSKIS